MIQRDPNERLNAADYLQIHRSMCLCVCVCVLVYFCMHVSMCVRVYLYML